MNKQKKSIIKGRSVGPPNYLDAESIKEITKNLKLLLRSLHDPFFAVFRTPRQFSFSGFKTPVAFAFVTHLYHLLSCKSAIRLIEQSICLLSHGVCLSCSLGVQSVKKVIIQAQIEAKNLVKSVVGMEIVRVVGQTISVLGVNKTMGGSR